MKDSIRHLARLIAVAAIPLALLGLVLSWPRESGEVEREVVSYAPAAVQTPIRPPTSIPDPEATARAQPPTSKPEPTYDPPPTFTPMPPPRAETFPPRSGAQSPNIAWSAQTEDTLTIWLGHYSDNPNPAITARRAVARWNDVEREWLDTRLDLVSMSVSPDERSLAVLLNEVCIAAPPPPTPTPDLSGTPQVGIPNTGNECEGFSAQHLYVINLDNGRVQPIPADIRGGLYNIQKIIGWFDNDRFGLEPVIGQMIVASKDGALFESRTWPGHSIYDTVYSLSLLPDHKTIFAWVGNEFYFRDAPTGDVHKVGNRLYAALAQDWLLAYDHLMPAPDGKLISHQEPVMAKDSLGYDSQREELWVQELATDQRYKLSDEGVWDFHPAWSPDSSRIAFAFSEGAAPNLDNWSVDFTRWFFTDIYIADVPTRTSHKLVDFTGAHNRDIQWTPGGNLVLSSTTGSQSVDFNLIAISTVDGKVTTLVSAKPGEQLVRPLLFVAESPGMPSAGSGEDR